MEQLLNQIIEVSKQTATVREETGFWPTLDHAAIDLGELIGCANGDSLVRSTEQALEGSYTDLNLRPAIVICWWRSIRLSAAEDEAAGLGGEPDFSPLLRCVDALVPTSLRNPEDMRWELYVAAAIGHRARVVRLLQEWQLQGMPASYLPVAVRMLFFLLAPMDDSTLQLEAWDPDIGLPEPPLYSIYAFIAWGQSLNVSIMRAAPKLDRPAALTERIDRAALRELGRWLGTCKDAGQIDSPEVQAIQAWTTYALGLLDSKIADIESAGALFEATPDMFLPDSTPVGISWKRWEAATLAYHDANALEKALRTAHQWAALASDKPPAFRMVAKMYQQLGRFEEGMLAFEKAIGEPSGGRDWEDSLLLQLGFEKLQGDAVSRAIARAADSTPFKEQGEELVAWMMPWYPRLCEKARQRLWHGLFQVSSPFTKANTGQAAWDTAGASFGEALAFELKSAVFKPFFEQHPGLAVSDDMWVQIRAGESTLGKALSGLLQTRQGNTAVSKQLGAWLYKNQPKLMGVVAGRREVLERVSRQRNEAQHGTLAPTSVHQLFEAVCEVFGALHGRGPDTKLIPS